MSKAFDTIFTAIIAEDEDLLTLLKDGWPCMFEDEKRLVIALRGGGVAEAGPGGGTDPSNADQGIPGLNTSTSGTPMTNQDMTATPSGRVDVFVNTQRWAVGDGVKTEFCYFSADDGATAKAMNAITISDTLFLGDKGALVGVTTDDLVYYCYNT